MATKIIKLDPHADGTRETRLVQQFQIPIEPDPTLPGVRVTPPVRDDYVSRDGMYPSDDYPEE